VKGIKVEVRKQFYLYGGGGGGTEGDRRKNEEITGSFARYILEGQ
jgi:hypothetical protein